MDERSTDTSHIQRTARRIYSCYHKAYAPPKWSLDEHLDLLHGQQAKCYCPRRHSIEQCRALLTLREPVNIAGQGADVYFNKQRLQIYFGHSQGMYNNRKVQYATLPNLSVYNTSPVRHISGNEAWEEVDRMHFLHCIGYAFDSKRQRDYKEILHNKTPSQYKPCLRRLYKHIFHTVFVCAKEHGLKKIALGLVGAGVFASLYPTDFRAEIFQPALEHAMQQHKWSLSNIATLGNDKITIRNRTLPQLGFFPAQCLSKIDAENTLVVNAWDPLSMVGNGNAGDNSLDGWIGRHTACAFMCFPPTNPSIAFEHV